ncbi:hypothetical protein [Parapoynx stagnalis nucleopolyhedrovirus]|uniref:Uncharacterized protein n=1 Tax=Parapoynx stagnalis nucleopolyhedrovirus TaxID=2993413 RepID=A0A9E7YE18_9ABAC|nr:hypothetical protein [Parapoynx stagnalis nucleopolyhedrovirus]
MNNKYATCYLCDAIVYLFKKELKTSALSNEFYKRHMAVIRNGFILCTRCNLQLENEQRAR